MLSDYARRVTILPGQVDASGRLGIPDTFELFMDTAAMAARGSCADWTSLQRRGVFWIAVKTMIGFVDRPRIFEDIAIDFRLEPPEGRRCRSHFRIVCSGEERIKGVTEWAFLDMHTKQQLSVASVIPNDMRFTQGAHATALFPRIDTHFEGESVSRHRVCASDIDMAGHMNNVAYIRAIVDAFSVEAWEELDIMGMSVVFLASAHEGDALRVFMRRSGRDMDLGIALPDGRLSVLARLTLG
ncbi:MAG: hypothetical protein IJJ45_12080 [Clostridia bacterium]|nr:hypothetical protein [Clostridia bacterium]